MNDMPDKIMARPVMGTLPQDGTTHSNGPWAVDNPYGNAKEYIRADKVQALVDALKECEEEIDAYIQHEYPHDHPVQERCRQRDYSANPARIALAQFNPAPKPPECIHMTAEMARNCPTCNPTRKETP